MQCLQYMKSSGGVKLYEYIPAWARKRMELNIPLDAFVLISVGELNQNKNNRVVIEALGKLPDKIYYILCGIGSEKERLAARAEKLGLSDRVLFLGYRTDVYELMGMADVFVLPSYREGLSRSLMEAMACGLPCVVSDIRGNTDLIDDGCGGFAISPDDKKGF